MKSLPAQFLTQTGARELFIYEEERHAYQSLHFWEAAVETEVGEVDGLLRSDICDRQKAKQSSAGRAKMTYFGCSVVYRHYSLS